MKQAEQAGRTINVVTTIGAPNDGVSFENVGDVTMGPSRELVLRAPGDGGLVAIFAPGAWCWAEVVQEAPSEPDEPTGLDYRGG